MSSQTRFEGFFLFFFLLSLLASFLFLFPALFLPCLLSFESRCCYVAYAIASQSRCAFRSLQSQVFGFLDFSENVDFWNFPVGFGVRGGLQSIENAYELQIHKFSAHIEPYGSIFDDFHDFGQFSVV